MANIKLLQEAIQAFANGDNEVADKKMRKYFVEQAQEINKKLEEEMEAEEEEVCEDVDTDPSEDMTDDVGYKLDEEEELDEGMFGFAGLAEEEEPEAEEADGDFGGEDDFSGEEAGAQPDADQWESIKSAFDSLERMFDEIEGGDADFDDQSDDFGDSEEETEDEFSDVDFGAEKVGEAYKMKSVTAPEKTEKAGVNKKSVVAPNAKSPVDGVKPVTIKDGTVDATDDKFENSDALSAKVEDNNNVMDSGKNVLKPVSVPKNTAATSKSPLPKQK